MVDRQILESSDGLFIEHGARIEGHLVTSRNQYRLGQHTSEHTFTQRLHHVTTFNKGRHRDAVVRFAIDFRDNQILRDVDEPARQVAGVGRLERRVGEALARAVRRDEVLQNVEALTEIGRDRCLDDGAVRLGHQSAHPGKLPDLCSRTASSRVCHHVDRVEGLLLDLLTLRVLD